MTANIHKDDPLLTEAAALHAHPRFEDAVLVYAEGLVRFRENTRLLAKLNANETRMRVVGYLLHLSAVRRIDGGDGAVSYGDLRAQVQGEVSDRVLKTMLAIMRLTGLVELRRNPEDRRVTLYRPTERLLRLARAMYATSARALDAIEPEARRAEQMSEALYFMRLLATAGRDHQESPPASRMPDFIAFFGGRDGAGPVTARLVEAQIQGRFIESRAALARRFGLSKTQVADVIAEGVRLGYFSLDATAVPVATPQLRDALGRWISIELAFMARHMPPRSR